MLRNFCPYIKSPTGGIHHILYSGQGKSWQTGIKKKNMIIKILGIIHH